MLYRKATLFLKIVTPIFSLSIFHTFCLISRSSSEMEMEVTSYGSKTVLHHAQAFLRTQRKKIKSSHWTKTSYS